jgi:predicted acyl esterase
MVQPSRGVAHPQYRIRTRLGVPVAMRDGVRLSTDVYLPDAAGPFPVILIRTPSNRVYTKGHRIRVEISSSNFPQFDRNPNTGHPFGLDAELAPATQTVYHDAAHPSHVVLPLVE